MRISDWSSDVCSSDLVDRAGGPRRPDRRSGARPGRDGGMTIAADVRYGAGEVMATMKAIGLDVGDYRLSIYSLFASLVVAVLLYAGAVESDGGAGFWGELAGWPARWRRRTAERR